MGMEFFILLIKTDFKSKFSYIWNIIHLMTDTYTTINSSV